MLVQTFGYNGAGGGEGQPGGLPEMSENLGR
jgi:hypothetical protein